VGGRGGGAKAKDFPAWEKTRRLRHPLPYSPYERTSFRGDHRTGLGNIRGHWEDVSDKRGGLYRKAIIGGEMSKGRNLNRQIACGQASATQRENWGEVKVHWIL